MADYSPSDRRQYKIFFSVVLTTNSLRTCSISLALIHLSNNPFCAFFIFGYTHPGASPLLWKSRRPAAPSQYFSGDLPSPTDNSGASPTGITGLFFTQLFAAPFFCHDPVSCRTTHITTPRPAPPIPMSCRTTSRFSLSATCCYLLPL